MRILLIVLTLISLTLPGLAKQPGFKLVQWTDIHAGGRHYSEAAFSEAVQKGLDKKPQGIVLTGDFCDNSHDIVGFPQRLRESLHLVANRLRDYRGPLFLAIGNDDVPHNYQTPPDELAVTLESFREAFGQRCYLDQLGNGVSPSDLGGIRWISINSLFFSTKNNAKASVSQSQRTLNWLREQLPTKPNAPPVVILTHLPPTWDLYLREPSWKLEYLRQFQEIISAYPGQIVILCGHYHRNHVQAIERPFQATPVLVSGALATKYGYASNWRELQFTLDEDGVIDSISYTIRYIGKSAWDSTYMVVPRRMNEFFEGLTGSDALYRRYFKDIWAHGPESEDLLGDGKTRDSVIEQFWLNTLEPVSEDKPESKPDAKAGEKKVEVKP